MSSRNHLAILVGINLAARNDRDDCFSYHFSYSHRNDFFLYGCYTICGGTLGGFLYMRFYTSRIFSFASLHSFIQISHILIILPAKKPFYYQKPILSLYIYC